MRRLAAAALMALAASPGAADASPPRPRAVDVCVLHGVVKGQPYIYRPFAWIDGKQHELDLSAFDGMALHIEGYLYPGDRIAVRTIRVAGRGCGK